MRLIEEDRFPGAPNHFVIERLPEPLRERAQFLRGEEQLFQSTGCLFQFNPAAVSALKNGIEIAADHRRARAFCNYGLEVCRHGVTNREWSIRQAIELLDQR